MFKCILCSTFTLKSICTSCQSSYFKLTIFKRKLPNDLRVISFYPYSEIEKFIKTKHTYHGSKIYKILANNSFKKFSQEYKIDSKVYILPIDDKVSSLYSHTAILAKSMKSKNIIPVYNRLRAQNNLQYSGKSLEFRLKNPRNFRYTFKPNLDVILVDDIITTGSTLSEAKRVLENYNVNVLFALTLADARY